MLFVHFLLWQTLYTIGKFMKELWTEKYRPNTIEEYVFRDSKQQSRKFWVGLLTETHLLFRNGTGKTTLAKVITQS